MQKLGKYLTAREVKVAVQMIDEDVASAPAPSAKAGGLSAEEIARQRRDAEEWGKKNATAGMQTQLSKKEFGQTRSSLPRDAV